VLLTSEETGFKITAAQLQKAIGPQSKALLLNSPSNPTGAAYTENELRQIAEVIEQSNLIVISDDVYEKFLYDSPRCAHLLALKPHLRDRVLIANSLSKTYAMTGWRLGYAAGPREVIAAIETLQSQSTSNPNSITQAAAVAALTGTQKPVGIMAKEFAKRRNYVVQRLRSMPGITCTLPEGAFYVFPCVSAYFGARWQERLSPQRWIYRSICCKKPKSPSWQVKDSGHPTTSASLMPLPCRTWSRDSIRLKPG
jgi:aspartate aminotransferase